MNSLSGYIPCLRFLTCLILAALCLSACQQTNKKQAAAAPPKQPNIIYILADDMGYGDLGCYGQKVIKTPHIDEMAAEGIRFTQHYAGTSVCAPSRASLMTGRDNGHSRVRGNYETGPFGFGGELELRPQDTTIAEVLKAAGYHTALIGKWGLGMNGTTGEPNKKGFDYSYGFLNQAHAHNQFPDYLFRNGKKEAIPVNASGKRGYFTNDIFTDDAVKYLYEQKKNGGPFFLFLAYVTPHAEMIVPEDNIFKSFKGKFKEVPYVQSMLGGNGKDSFGVYHSQKYPEAAYASMITRMDNDVYKVMSLIKQLGLDDNTVIMFSSDNGPHREGGNNPDYFKSGGPFRGYKRDLYEGGIRVPFIARWPGVIKPGVTTGQLSAFWDMMPTMADMAHASLKNVTTEGYSLLPIMLGKPAEQKQHPYFYFEFHENKYSDQAVRKGDWKAVRHDPDKPLELYDLSKDIAEQHNVAAQHPEIVKQMEQIMVTARVDNPYFPMKRSGAKK